MHRLDHLCRMIRAFDHWHQNGLHAKIEKLLYHPHLAHGRADDNAGSAANGLHLRQNRGNVVRAVFAVDQEPIKPSTRQRFGGDRADKVHPKAHLHGLGGKGGF